MKNYTLGIILINLIVCTLRCVCRRKKCDTTQTYHRTGEAIAVDNLIETYEKEHEKLYQENKEGDHLDWPELESKNLSEYCSKYLQHVVPTRSVDEFSGTKTKRNLYYVKHNVGTTMGIIVVLCKLTYKSCPVAYHITRASEPNCAYALKCTGNWTKFILTIINKYCDFEDKPFYRPPKWNTVKIVSKIHRATGQPIAKDKYLLKYELEHHEMLRRFGDRSEYIDWPRAKLHPNLNFYCYQFLNKHVSKRNREALGSRWTIEKLKYQNLKGNMDISVTTITCVSSGGKHYYITRAPEANCVYGLLRKSCGVRTPVVITFKYCDFEDPNPQQQDYNVLGKNVIPKATVKKEEIGTLETLQLFPNY